MEKCLDKMSSVQEVRGSSPWTITTEIWVGKVKHILASTLFCPTVGTLA